MEIIKSNDDKHIQIKGATYRELEDYLEQFSPKRGNLSCKVLELRDYKGESLPENLPDSIERLTLWSSSARLPAKLPANLKKVDKLRHVMAIHLLEEFVTLIARSETLETLSLFKFY